MRQTRTLPHELGPSGSKSSDLGSDRSNPGPQEAVMAEYRDREHFIPVRKTDLVELLCAAPGLEAADRDAFRRFCRRLDATLHCEYHQRLEDLKDAYALFDPDSDTQVL